MKVFRAKPPAGVEILEKASSELFQQEKKLSIKRDEYQRAIMLIYQTNNVCPTCDGEGVLQGEKVENPDEYTCVRCKGSEKYFNDEAGEKS